MHKTDEARVWLTPPVIGIIKGLVGSILLWAVFLYVIALIFG